MTQAGTGLLIAWQLAAAVAFSMLIVERILPLLKTRATSRNCFSTTPRRLHRRCELGCGTLHVLQGRTIQEDVHPPIRTHILQASGAIGPHNMTQPSF